MKSLPILGALGLLLASHGVSAADRATGVDLHAHLFFHEGMGIYPFVGGLGLGNFHDSTLASSWKSRLRSKVNAEELERSHVAIAVVALYSHPLFALSQRQSIRRQIHEAEGFVQVHPDWILARSPEEARSGLAAGKRVLVLSLEGMSSVLESEADLHEFIDELGIRIVTPLHFTDDRFGGAAFLPGALILDDPFAALASLFAPHRDDDGVRINPAGLTEEGRQMIEALVARGVWIDFSHASDASQKDLAAVIGTRQPLLYTHTVLRKYLRAERGISAPQLARVHADGGIIGILPSDDYLEGTAVVPAFCPADCAGRCAGGIAAFRTQFAETANAVGPKGSVMIGSDIDAPLSFLQPACPAERERDAKGLATYGQLQELFQVEDSAPMAEAFIRSWDKVRHP